MIKLAQIISLLILSPLFFPVFVFCPFRLPYLYCFVCPVRCVWSKIRGLTFLLAMGLNLRRQSFCNYLCPFGSLQALLYNIKTKKISWPRRLRLAKFISVALIVLIVFFTKLGNIGLVKIHNLLWGIFLFSILASIFTFRFFCNFFCPIKALSELKKGN